jgi:hypothetical protein
MMMMTLILRMMAVLILVGQLNLLAVLKMMMAQHSRSTTLGIIKTNLYETKMMDEYDDESNDDDDDEYHHITIEITFEEIVQCF